MATSYNSYSYLAAAAAAASAQHSQQQPVVGSLEALRANAVWNMPHGPAFHNGQPNAAYLGTSHARCEAEHTCSPLLLIVVFQVPKTAGQEWCNFMPCENAVAARLLPWQR